MVEGEEEMREYKKGNWTVNETMVLIEAKRKDYERRMKRPKEIISERRVEETRWKWVEEYCWRHGCCRSQNQCNDRWDNLMRDYKKVRTHESGLGDHNGSMSYWKLDRHERKTRNLPCNLWPEIYEALTEVVQRRGVERGSGVGGSTLAGTLVEEREAAGSISFPMPVLMPHSNPPTRPEASEPPSSLPVSAHAQPLITTDSEESEHSELPGERKRKREDSSSNRSNTNELSSAISRCASIFAEALQTSQLQEDKRHRDLMQIEQRKAKLDESKSEISAQAINGLATAINKLASSILGLVTEKATGAPK